MTLKRLTSIGRFSLRITGGRHLPHQLRVILLSATLPHVQLPPVLVAFLERHRGPVLTVVHQLLEGHLDVPDEVVL